MRKTNLYELISFGLAVCLITAFFVGAALVFKRDAKAYKNAMRYCEENNVTCFSKKGSIAFVFSDCSIIGANAMAEYYEGK